LQGRQSRGIVREKEERYHEGTEEKHCRGSRGEVSKRKQRGTASQRMGRRGIVEEAEERHPRGSKGEALQSKQMKGIAGKAEEKHHKGDR
jgi:hypothetical protein